MKRGKILCFLVIMLLSLQLAYACVDDDGDDYGLEGASDCTYPGLLDCNDNDFMVHPGTAEVCGNLIDDNCDGNIDEGTGEGCAGACTDSDRDGYYVEAECGEADCDDASAMVNPGMAEICDNGLDDNCDEIIDGDDPGCRIEVEEEEECHIFSAMWVGCDGVQSISAHEGDSIYLIVLTQYCPATVNFDYRVYEHDEGERDLVAELDEEYYLHDSYFSLSSWGASWITQWADDDGTDPEYYFEAEMTNAGDIETMESGTSSDKILVVEQCPEDDADCATVCELADYMHITEARDEGGPISPIVTECVPDWDCSAAVWSECDPSTNMKTRDTTFCTYIGEGDAERCSELYRVTVNSEASCIVAKEEGKATKKRTGPKCGNDKCEKGEDEESCPEDCAVAKFPWFWILLIGVLVLIALSVGAYFIKKKFIKKKKAASPFKSEKEASSVVNYIKKARAKGYKNPLISAALKKHGWKDAHVKYAMGKAAKK